MEIYADVVFLINWAMDLFLFWLTGVMGKKKLRLWRLVSGSAVAALLYCILIFAPAISRYYNFFSSLIMLMSGIIIAFGIKDLKEFTKLLVLAHISAFAVGGIGSAIFYYSNIGYVLGNALGFTINYFSLKILIAATCSSYIVIKIALKLINNLSIKKQAIYNIRIAFGGKTAELPVLVDTGHALTDPIGKAPVIIAEFEYIQSLLPEKMRELYYIGAENDLSMVISALSGSEMEQIIRMIPYKSLGNENGMLMGFKPCFIEIEKENSTTRLENAVIGIYNLSLTKGGKYHGLLSPMALEAEI